MKASVFEIVTK